MRGDCLEKMKEIPSGSVDLILTDPPYGTTACKWDNVIPFEPMWEQIWRVLKPNGACVLFGSEPFSSHLRMSQIKYFKYDWVWCKNLPSNPAVAKRMPMRWHENIHVFFTAQPLYVPQKESCSPSTRKRWKDGEENKNYTSVRKHDGHFTFTSKNIMRHEISPKSYLSFDVHPRAKGTVHPTQKPVALLEYLIKTYTNEGETVLDFTMGSGSTGVACVNTDRRFIGIEMDRKYFVTAGSRIADAMENLYMRSSVTGTV